DVALALELVRKAEVDVADVAQARELLRTQRDAERAKIVFELRKRAGTEERDEDARLLAHPRDGYLRRRAADFFGHFDHGFGDGQPAFLRGGAGGDASFFGRVLAVVFARQHTRAQDAPRRHAQVQRPRHRQEFALCRAVDEAVAKLEADE